VAEFFFSPLRQNFFEHFCRAGTAEKSWKELATLDMK
jgi:hypothetical protein